MIAVYDRRIQCEKIITPDDTGLEEEIARMVRNAENEHFGDWRIESLSIVQVTEIAWRVTLISKSDNQP